MTLPTSYPTSKKNALASLRKFVKEQCIDPVANQDTNYPWSFYTVNYNETLNVPSVCVTIKGLPDLGDTAFGNYLGGVEGSEHRFLAEITIQDRLDPGNNPEAEQRVLEMRERIWYALNWSGVDDESGSVEVPKITLWNFDTNPISDTNSVVYFPSGEMNNWFETPSLADPKDPALKQIQISARIHYMDYRPQGD